MLVGLKLDLRSDTERVGQLLKQGIRPVTPKEVRPFINDVNGFRYRILVL